MREGIKTSLLSIVCVAALSTAAHAAASVRSVGGAGAYPSASSAAAPVTSSVATSSASSSRAGSLRATGGYVRPTATISTAAKAANGSVATGDSTTSRAASAPRLSIGKYVGAPKSISQTSSTGKTVDLTEIEQRLDSLETLEEQLEREKQDNIAGSAYITLNGTRVELNTEALINDLNLHSGVDGRPIELDADNDDGIKWHYVARDGEEADAWKLLVSWDNLKNQMDITEMNTTINNAVTRIETLETNVTQLGDDLDTKLDKNQKPENVGKMLQVGADGELGLVVVDHVERKQGTGKAGQYLKVDNEGYVTTDTLDIPEIDVSGKVDKQQGTANAGKGLIVNGESGDLELTDKPFGELAYKGLITEEDIKDESITTRKLAPEAVTTEKLANGAVTTPKIAEHAVTNTELASEIVSDIAKGKQAFDFVEWWETHKPTTDEGYDGQDVLLSIGPDGAPQWYLVAE